MNTLYKCGCLAICLALAACGNKGDLYLNPVELSDEQKALLDELEGESEEETDEEKARKKKTESDESVQ